MLKKLEQQAVRADLISVEALLATRTREADPIGFRQFARRKEMLEQHLAELESRSPSHSVALLFGGRPVVGSHGIAADFSVTMISSMQSLVSARSASIDRPLGERGPIPQRDKSQMLITDVARGSFGFVLEDASNDSNDKDSLGTVMDGVCDLLARLGSEDAERFDSATENVDTRTLTALKNFFSALEYHGATLRLVSDQFDFELTREAVERARERTEILQVFEPYFETIAGRVYTMPDSKRFELLPLGGGAAIRGNISTDFIKEMFDENLIASGDFLGKVMNAKLRVRERRFGKEEVRKAYSLVNVQPYEGPTSPIVETDPLSQS